MRVGIGIGVPSPVTGSGGFTPANFGDDLILWLAADHGITEDTGGVSDWVDRGANVETVAQATSGNRPAYDATGWSNDSPVVDFTRANADHFDVTMTTQTSTDYTVWCVCNPETITASNFQLLLSCNGGTDFAIAFHENTGEVGILNGGTWRACGAATTGEQVLRWELDATGGTVEVFRDDVSIGSDTYAPSGMVIAGTTTIGCYRNGINHPYDGQIAEIVVVRRLPTAAEIAGMGGYLS